MDPERWRQVKEIFETVLDTHVSDRAAVLTTAIGDDEALRREVESLLEHAEREDALDRSPVVRPPAAAPGEAVAGSTAPAVVDEVSLVELPPYSRLHVWTRRTRYMLVVVAPFGAELLLQGGERFPQPVTAFLPGAGDIAVGRRLAFRIGERRVHTSRVRRIEINPVRDSSPA